MKFISLEHLEHDIITNTHCVECNNFDKNKWKCNDKDADMCTKQILKLLNSQKISFENEETDITKVEEID